ncbi:hypothetical protein JZ751_004087 [Albula glossodonta]|uniref:Uncharacterized protein n=1 Tax=Albula glossodonta TaxID=121402 RepID=A0A8T2PEK0_9TELE|nr:hypothetical protein JZ751_004087 [Albula glossodonta]
MDLSGRGGAQNSVCIHDHGRRKAHSRGPAPQEIRQAPIASLLPRDRLNCMNRIRKPVKVSAVKRVGTPCILGQVALGRSVRAHNDTWWWKISSLLSKSLTFKK